MSQRGHLLDDIIQPQPRNIHQPAFQDDPFDDDDPFENPPSSSAGPSQKGGLHPVSTQTQQKGYALDPFFDE